MLIEFTVGNYLSIKDKQTLRMDASSVTEYQDRLIDAGRYKLLRSAVIYGANASGKSNVLKAMATMREIITTSVAHSSTDPIPVEPFLLSTETENAPSYFEMMFLIEGIRYRYGFEADKERVHAEWLFEAKKQQEKALFVREGGIVEVSKVFKEGKGLEERTRENALFLAVCDQFNGSTAKKIMIWLIDWRIASGIDHEEVSNMSLRFLNDNILKDSIDSFIRSLNLGFEDINLKDEYGKSIEQIKKLEEYTPERARLIDRAILSSQHKKFDKNKEVIGFVDFDFKNRESSGTKKIIDLLGYMFGSIFKGVPFVIDELDSKLHPLLTKEIIDLFNSPVTNYKNAQLIFATHDTNLLTYGQFRRDQIYFTEKDQYGATSLYSLVDYKEEDGSTVRKDRSFEKDYIQGRYGAIPYIGDFSKLIS